MLFKQQVLRKLPKSTRVKNLLIFPTNGAKLYRYQGRWKQIYSSTLSSRAREKVIHVLHYALDKAGYEKPSKTHGKQIEDRGAQITFSAVGQRAPLAIKQAWNRKFNAVRFKMLKIMQPLLPQFTIRAGGLTSIDITKKGVDKGYVIKKVCQQCNVRVADILFVGDAIYPGGNDYAVVRTGVDYIKVKNPQETKKIIKRLLRRIE